MPNIDTYTFPHKELLEMMIKAAKVREGEWMLQVNFSFSAGNFGPDDDHMNPGSIAMINSVGITKAKSGAPRALVMNAAEVKGSST